MKRGNFLWRQLLAAGMSLSFIACGLPGVEVRRETAVLGSPPHEVRVSAESDAAEPAVAVGSDGATYVVFVEHAVKSSGDVFVQKFTTDLKPDGPKTRISPDSSAKTWRGDPPSVAAGPGGELYVAWTRALSTGKGNDLVLSVSRDGGKSFDPPVKINDDAGPASHGMHSLTVGTDGRVYAAWLDERNVKAAPQTASIADTQAPQNGKAVLGGFEYVQVQHNGHSQPAPAAEAEPNSEVFFAYSTDGGRTFSANKRVAGDVCPCCKTSMLAAADGKVYVSWRQVLPGDLRHIAVASTADKGETFSERTIVSDDQWRLHACPVSGAALADAGGGKLSVTWYTAGDAGQAGLYSAESTDGGKSFGTRRLVSLNAAAGTPVTFSNSETCVFASEGNKIDVKGLQARSETVENATLPAATMAGGRVVMAFVRPDADKRSVWVTAVSN